jgi:hypothetical protein
MAMAKTAGAGAYLPEELALVVQALGQGCSLSSVAAELGRDRSGLCRHLKTLGFPTKPQQLDAAQRRVLVEQAMAFMGPLTRDEIKQQILELRRLDRRTPPPP